MWVVRGWNRLTVHDDPPLVAARQEFQSWLTEVPEPWQSNWRGRLESRLDHPHLSVRLELYLHHYFKSEGWAIDIEPEIRGSPNKPDFRIKRCTDMILVEAKAILDEQTIAQEMQRLRQLADNLSGKLSRDVIIEPLSDLPPSLPTRKIKAQIEQRVKTQADEVVEFDFSDVHQGMQYSVRVALLPKSPDRIERVGVGGTISGVHTLTMGKRIRDALEEKAGKYGPIDIPFVIAVYGVGEFPVQTGDEFDALFGDRVWSVHSASQVTERRKPNGFFSSEREGGYRHQDVSAVLFYRLKWLGDTHAHMAYIYHNPFASKPVNPELSPGLSQAVLDDDGILKWIDGKSK